MTVTLAAPKLPLVLPPAETRAGDIVIADIGIPADVIEALDGPRVELLTRGAMRELITPRTPDSHKGDYGRVLIVAGSRGKTGAAHLAGARRAAIGRRAGHGRDAGVLPADRRRDGARVHDRSRSPRRDDGLDPARVDRVLELARDVIAIGPGLGQAPGDARLRPGARRSRDDAARARRRRPERVRRRPGSAGRPRGARRDHHAASRARWRGWSACRPTRCRRAASRSRATSPPRITSTSC